MTSIEWSNLIQDNYDKVLDAITKALRLANGLDSTWQEVVLISSEGDVHIFKAPSDMKFEDLVTYRVLPVFMWRGWWEDHIDTYITVNHHKFEIFLDSLIYVLAFCNWS